MGKREGIAVVGTLLVDNLYEISAYPAEGELTKIRSVSLACGGLVPNNGIGLKKIDPALPVFAVGKVGDDDAGKHALRVMREAGVDARCDRQESEEEIVMTIHIPKRPVAATAQK